METNSFSNRGSALSGECTPVPGRAHFDNGFVSELGMKWSALHEAAETVGIIAGVDGKAMTAEVSNFPIIMREVTGPLRELAEQGLADLTAVMEPGLSALLAAHARGADPKPAAGVLWQEFLDARCALMALVPKMGRAPSILSA